MSFRYLLHLCEKPNQRLLIFIYTIMLPLWVQIGKVKNGLERKILQVFILI